MIWTSIEIAGMNMLKPLKLAAAAALMSISLLSGASSANAMTLGLDLTSPSNTWVTRTNVTTWTLGYEFNLSQDARVGALGFWDANGAFGDTTVGLWTSSGTLIGTVSSSSSAVTTVATQGGHGNWYFMEFVTDLAPGYYVVASHGQSGMDYVYNFGAATLSTSIASYVDD